MDGDGMVDLVASIHGDIDHYDVERGNEDFYDGVFIGRVEEPRIFDWPQCTQQDEICLDLSECDRSCIGPSCDVNWDDVRTCVANAPEVSCSSINAVGAGDSGQPAVGSRGAYQRCEGRYPWIIYKNLGGGEFAPKPKIKYQPIPLEADSGDSSITSDGVYAQNQAVMDFDGDGFLDAISRMDPATGSPSPAYWQVWLGDRTGGFGSKRYIFPTRIDTPVNLGRNAISKYNIGPGNQTTAGLFDLNADGLMDHWNSTAANGANFTWNLGDRFEVVTPGNVGVLSTATNLKTASDAFLHSQQASMLYPTFFESGFSEVSRRLYDFDSDGRLDILFPGIDPASSERKVHLNLGGQIDSRQRSVDSPLLGYSRTIEASAISSEPDPNPYIWELKSDMLDLDGNGLLESVAFVGLNIYRVKEQVSAPPRMMTSIANGRGGRMTVSYSSFSDNLVVEQRPDLFWADTNQPKSTPLKGWVVSGLSRHDDVRATTATTTYKYRHPRHGADAAGKYGFRGFETAVITSASGARVVETFGYDVDWSGRSVRTSAFSAEANPNLSSPPLYPYGVDTFQWKKLSLFGGKVSTYHLERKDVFTCENGLLEAVCLAQAANLPKSSHIQTVSSFSKLVTSASADLAWQETSSVNRSGAVAVNGERSVATTFSVTASPIYRINPIQTSKYERVNGSLSLYGRTIRGWDSTGRVLLTEAQWINTSGTSVAVTRREYDMSTGSLTREFKPEQNANNGSGSLIEYDQSGIFANKITNELGHVVFRTYEPGTGALVQTDGPAARSCTSCVPVDDTHPVLERTRTRIDGLGRPLEEWITIGDSQFTLVQVAAFSYTLGSSQSFPSSVVSQQLVDDVANTWTYKRSQIDGHGRPLEDRSYLFDGSGREPTTAYQYDATGSLIAVSVPDPRHNNNSTVTHTYAYDSLGRLTSHMRPTEFGAASGRTVVYNGRLTVAKSVTGSGGGNVKETRTTSDAFGRVSMIEESAYNSASFSSTLYTYGPDDTVRAITSPLIGSLEIQSDLAGRRTKVSRPGGREWLYTYDRNGNVRTEVVPHSPMENPLSYTTSIVYDSLDRPVSRLVPDNGLSIVDRDNFSSNLEALIWDTVKIGELTSWTAKGPSPGAPEVTVSSRYDAQRLQNQSQLIAPWGTLTSGASYFPGGRVKLRSDLTAGVTSSYQYDSRGLAKSVSYFPNGIQTTVATLTRNSSGAVVKRTSFDPLSSDTVEAHWQYDVLGRRTQQRVHHEFSQIPLISQTIQYDGNDNVQGALVERDGDARYLQYGYDHAGRVTEASSLDDYFNASYTYQDDGRISGLTQTRQGAFFGNDSRLLRSVFYLYEDDDPERLTRLIDAETYVDYASYEYDEAGNLTSRQYHDTDEQTFFTYDGKGQLRRAITSYGGVAYKTEEYWYDGAGQRVRLLTTDGYSGPVESVSFWGGTEYHAPVFGAPFNRSSINLETAVAKVGYGTLEYFFHGLAGSTLAGVSRTGQLNASFVYSPYGEVLEATNDGWPDRGADSHARRHNDKYTDFATGLIYYGARYYDPVMTGWTQADPLYLRAPDYAMKSTPNNARIYTYSLGNPLRYVDPDGLFPRMLKVSDYRSEMEMSPTFEGRSSSQDSSERGLCEWGSDACGGSNGGAAIGLLDGTSGWKRGGCHNGGFCNEQEDEVWALMETMGWRRQTNREIAVNAVNFTALILLPICPSCSIVLAGTQAANEGDALFNALSGPLGRARVASAVTAVERPAMTSVLPSALQGGKRNSHVYIGMRDGLEKYAGITVNPVARARAHRHKYDLHVITGDGLSRGEARAVEQALINRGRGTYENINNSISPRHDYYDDAVRWGEEWLTKRGY